VKAGETFLRSYSLSEDDGSPVNLTGWVITSAVSKGTTTVICAVVVTDAPNGAFEVSVPSATTRTMVLGEWQHDVRITDPLGVVVYSQTQRFQLEAPITPNP